MGTFLQAAGSLASDYATSLLQAVLTLALIAGLAFVVLRFGAARGLLQRGRGKLIQIEEAVPLDTKNSLVIVRIEERRLLLATHGQEAARLIAELEPRPHEARPGP